MYPGDLNNYWKTVLSLQVLNLIFYLESDSISVNVTKNTFQNSGKAGNVWALKYHKSYGTHRGQSQWWKRQPPVIKEITGIIETKFFVNFSTLQTRLQPMKNSNDRTSHYWEQLHQQALQKWTRLSNAKIKSQFQRVALEVSILNKDHFSYVDRTGGGISAIIHNWTGSN